VTPAEFLTTLWGETPPGQVLVWTLPDKRSTWFTSFVNADKFVQGCAGKDVYTGVSLGPKDAKLTDRVRVYSDQSAGIAGLWADIDIASPEHQKQNLPPTQADALSILQKLGYEPSITVHSGHGLQCWWLFTYPWVFKDAQERRLAQNLCHSWNDLLAKAFQKHGWTIDSTYDLARVMRVPGTVNHKSEPVNVKVLQTSPFRWRDLPKLPAATGRPQGLHPEAAPVKVGELHLTPDLEPPTLKLELLLEAYPKFRFSWEGKRSDMTDQSASAYDMSLASIAVQAGFSDQEVLALLVAHRRRVGADLKLRLDYYQRTIGKARAGML
jgi:hypothetical protein